MTAIRYANFLGHGLRAICEGLASDGQRLAGQLGELASRPSRDGCDQMIRNLAEASTAVAHLRTQLERGGGQ